jgi:tRNA-modifying protein YgfZ
MTPLDDYRLISVSGPDRITFLQGQLTLDLRQLLPGQWALGGWAEPSGRLLMVARVICTDEAILLLVPAELMDSLARRLSMYVLRAKAVVDEDTAQRAYALSPGESTPPGLTALAGPDAGQFSLALGPAGAGSPGQQPDLAGPLDWTLANIRAGIGEVRSATSGEFLPQMLNLDLLGAIAFDKGCYVGQEIVARTHYRGRLKRRMFRMACVLPPPAPGARVVNAAGATVGQVVCGAPADATHGELLAVVQLDAAGEALFLDQAGGTPLQRLDLPYPLPVSPAGG